MMKLKDLDMKGYYTYADYLSWKLEETVELIKGKLFRMAPAPNRFHQEIAGNLFFRIQYFFSNQACKVYHAPFDVRLPLPPHRTADDQIDTVVQPDISVICDLKKLDLKGCLGAPDWIIEILSPSTAGKDVKEKFEVYEFAGVKEYWIAFPVEKTVQAYFPGADGKYATGRPYHSNDRVRSRAFPDLVIDLRQVFPQEDIAAEELVEYMRL